VLNELDRNCKLFEACAARKQRDGMTKRKLAAPPAWNSEPQFRETQGLVFALGSTAEESQDLVQPAHTRQDSGFTGLRSVSGARIGGNRHFTLINQVLLRNLRFATHTIVAFGSSESGGIAGGISLAILALFPWDFTRQMQANPGPFRESPHTVVFQTR